MRRNFLCLIISLSACGLAAGQSHEKVLYTFSGSDGSSPRAKLVFDRAGNLYGTTAFGGAIGWGTVFELSANDDGSWSETVLYSFCQNFDGSKCVDGSEPLGGLIIDDAGDLYGTTNSGGNQPCPRQTAGCGTVFELSPPSSPGSAWTYNVLYNLCTDNQTNCADGALPFGELLFDGAGNLYGTTSEGGIQGAGAVFELSPTHLGWTEAVLYSFCSVGKYPFCLDGLGPRAGVILDEAGSLYGTTPTGGSSSGEGGGVVYKLSPSTNGWNETVVRAFPVADLLATVKIYDHQLYSTNSAGGAFGFGGVFRLSLEGAGSEIASFNGTTGASPVAGVLIDPANGNVYGTTSGANSAGTGTVFEIAGGQLTVLYYFDAGGNSGAAPVAALIADSKGNLYGTTASGGNNNQGIVFEIAP